MTSSTRRALTICAREAAAVRDEGGVVIAFPKRCPRTEISLQARRLRASPWQFHVNLCYTFPVKEARNITLTLPADLLRKAKVLAAQRETSVSRLVAGVLEDLVETENGYALAKQRSLDRLAEPRPLGTKGRIEWQREELHER